MGAVFTDATECVRIVLELIERNATLDDRRDSSVYVICHVSYVKLNLKTLMLCSRHGSHAFVRTVQGDNRNDAAMADYYIVLVIIRISFSEFIKLVYSYQILVLN